MADFATYSEMLCGGWQPMVESAIQYHEMGYPLSMAEDLVEAALNQDHRLWSFLIDSINLAYRLPEELAKSLDNGTWAKACVKAIT